ncbi:hypothetical protein PHET_08527 [Paragonimus heterotremus]|uniref:Uncharacterized protein n=1 Tax=Paragonimus heterotremus TaxID=100268 RepID=A0A8J4WV26_9TREM|nr:hypothetical protein PHET_08527 [Paragonimus heterotremus]
MVVVPVTIILFALLSDASAQNGTLPRNLTSTFRGLLAYNLRLVEFPANLTEENRTNAQTDVCKQLTYLVPWYYSQRNISNCSIVGTDRNLIVVKYTIPLTEGFLQTHDSLCSTYYILLANLVRRTRAFEKRFYMQDITLENGNSGQPSNPSSGDHGSTTIGVDGSVKNSGRWVRWAGFILNDTVTREVQNNVKRQIAEFLLLPNVNDSNISTKPFGVYEDPDYEGDTRMKANITIKNSMLAANRINYTCSSFRQLIKACLDSPFFNSRETYIGWPVDLLDEKSDSLLPTETTPAQERTEEDFKAKDSTSTQGGGDGKSDGSSPSTTTDSPTFDQSTANNSSVVTTNTTIPGSVERMTFRYTTLISHISYHTVITAEICHSVVLQN